MVDGSEMGVERVDQRWQAGDVMVVGHGEAEVAETGGARRPLQSQQLRCSQLGSWSAVYGGRCEDCEVVGGIGLHVVDASRWMGVVHHLLEEVGEEHILALDAQWYGSCVDQQDCPNCFPRRCEDRVLRPQWGGCEHLPRPKWALGSSHESCHGCDRVLRDLQDSDPWPAERVGVWLCHSSTKELYAHNPHK